MLSTTQPIPATSAVEVFSDIMHQLKLMLIVQKPTEEFQHMFANFALAALIEGHRFASVLRTTNSIQVQYMLEGIIRSYRLNISKYFTKLPLGAPTNLRDVPQFQGFYLCFKEHYLRLMQSLLMYKRNPNKLSLARHCAITIENSVGIFMQLSALLRNGTPPPATHFDHTLFNAEFEEGYTWVVKAAPAHKKILIHRMKLNGFFTIQLGNSALMDRMSDGVVYLILNPWDSSVLGFFILNTDVQEPSRTADGRVRAYYIEIDSSFEGCGMSKRVVEWIWNAALDGGYPALSVLPLGNDLQSCPSFWGKLGFTQSCATTEWYKRIPSTDNPNQAVTLASQGTT